MAGCKKKGVKIEMKSDTVMYRGSAREASVMHSGGKVWMQVVNKRGNLHPK